MSRTNRAQETRENTTRVEYTPPSNLPNPDPQPGVVFRWVATHVLGVADPTNVSRKLRDGWEPVKAEDHPELSLLGIKSGNVEVGGLMLCKKPEEQASARTRYYEELTKRQMDSVDNNFMQQNDPRMPKFSESKSRAVRGPGFGSGT